MRSGEYLSLLRFPRRMKSACEIEIGIDRIFKLLRTREVDAFVRRMGSGVHA